MNIRNIILGSLLFSFHLAWAHCEIPCGIYDDHARIHQIQEHLGTIEKAMNQIKAIGSEEKPNWNQLVRWVTTKEKHASDIQEIISQYFLTQRIKPSMKKKYEKLLVLSHQIQVGAMKCKQTILPEHVKKMHEDVAQFEKMYFKAIKK